MSPLENRRSFGTYIHILLLLPIHHEREKESGNERREQVEEKERKLVANIWNGSE